MVRRMAEGLVFAPPLSISHEELDHRVDTLHGCIDTVWRQHVRA
jgi:adenosylmethionine-8-amino-7-oxononanoate aminotransferase